jgi:hypothetical protein
MKEGIAFTFRGYIQTGYPKFNQFANGSVCKILKWHINLDWPLTKAILKQAGKYPKSLQQYWAEQFWYSCLVRLRCNELPLPKKAHKKRKKKRYEESCAARKSASTLPRKLRSTTP